MARQIPEEVHVGQRIWVRLDPTQHPIEALIVYLDADEGMIHVRPVGYDVRWKARPRALMTRYGKFIEFKDQRFTYCEQRSIA